jgi:uncharacterized protein (DUF427 family)
MAEPHVTVERARHLRVVLAGATLADTDNGYVVHERGLPDRYYIPRADVRARTSDGTGAGTCPWKGQWKHLDVELDGHKLANGAWTYYETTPVCAAIKDHIAFYENKVTIQLT